MDNETFQREYEQIKSANTEQQKEFYQRVLDEENAPTKVRLLSRFYYSLIFYREGNFRKVREILEPLIFNYQSYAYTPELISCFNLMGVASHCEGEYELTRFFYQRGMQIAQENGETSRYSYEYNNIALAYISEGDYESALKNILLAEQHLFECDGEMGAYVYLNLAIIYHNLNKLDDALWSFERSINKYHADKIIPDDVLICGTTIYYKLGDTRKYQEYQDKLLGRLDQMFASEFVDASQAVFDCALASQDDALARIIVQKMDAYMERFPHEINICLWVEECKYKYAKMRQDEHSCLLALEKKDAYYQKIMLASERANIKEIEHYLRINKQLQESIQNETHANQVKTRFLANMSHDIRTPINGVIGMLEVIKSCRDNEEKVNDCLDKIEASSRLLLSLVNDILDMTKLDSDTVVLEHKPFNLDAACDEVCKVLNYRAEQERLTLEQTHADVSDVNLIGSPVHLQKILTNLFSNSIKYNKPGGAIYTSLREISHTADVATYEFKIRDTGIGMTQEFIEKELFTPFVQENNVARSKYGGSGLGMAIVAQLVKKMSGTITVDSKLGEGTCFTVILPFEIDKNPAQPVPDNDISESIHGTTLLVVEDNELNMEIAEFVLEDAGAAVQKAENGQTAVEKFISAPAGTYDAILMDLMMPVMDGYEATKAIRESSKADAKSIPIIAMSANAYEEDVQKCLEIGMNAHLGKPLFKDKLISTIAKFIKMKSS